MYVEGIIIYITLVFVVAFIFFGLIPGIGAFIVRSRWRGFRKRLIELSLKPFVSYSEISEREVEGENREIGEFRFFGTIEAIQGNDTLWMKNGGLSIAVDMEGVMVYMLPSSSIFENASPVENLQEILPDEEPKSIPWNGIFSLPEGTRAFVGGMLFFEKGNVLFKSTPEKKLIFVIYDGCMETILKRAIWGGRQKNEYFNQFTFGSILAGSFSLLFTAFILLHNPMLRIPSLLAVTLATFPVAALLPPGVIFYFLYRWSWKLGRIFRAKRDLLKLPLRYFKNDNEELTLLPTGEQYIEVCSVFKDDLIKVNKGFVLIRKDDSIIVSDVPVIREGTREFKNLKDINRICIYGAVDGNRLKKPLDPMAELVVIPGYPAIESKRCQSKARIYEVLSAIFIFSDLIINMFLVLLVLHRYIM